MIRDGISRLECSQKDIESCKKDVELLLEDGKKVREEIDERERKKSQESSDGDNNNSNNSDQRRRNSVEEIAMVATRSIFKYFLQI